MKKYIAIFLALSIVLTLFTGCFAKQQKEVNKPKAKVDTAYPNDTSNSVTVEQAMKDLRSHSSHDCLDNGTIVFEKKTEGPVGYSGLHATYWFNITVQKKIVNKNYRAKVIYHFLNSDFVYQSCDLWETSYTFTEMGVYEYSDSDASIQINFIKDADPDPGYIVEYEIAYFAQYWASSEWVTSSSDGQVRVYGENVWDGETYYLSIDLGEFYGGESDSAKDRGSIRIYPDKGVYWYTLHADNSPYKLHKQ